MKLAPQPITLFTIEPRRWYAMEITFPSGSQHASPILTLNIRPAKTGSGMLKLEFLHAEYPEGVQRKEYRLRVLRRDCGYILAEEAETNGARIVMIRALTAEWLNLHHIGPQRCRAATDDLEVQMDGLYFPAGRAAIGL